MKIIIIFSILFFTYLFYFSLLKAAGKESHSYKHKENK